MQYKNDKWASAQREFNNPRICFWAAKRENLITRKYQRLQYLSLWSFQMSHFCRVFSFSFDKKKRFTWLKSFLFSNYTMYMCTMKHLTFWIFMFSVWWSLDSFILASRIDKIIISNIYYIVKWYFKQYKSWYAYSNKHAQKLFLFFHYTTFRFGIWT